MDPYLNSNSVRQISSTVVNDDSRDNIGLVNTEGITNLRIHKRGYIQYSLDNGKSWHNSSKQFLNLFVEDEDPDPGEPGIKQIEFKTHMEFPNIGKADMLYVATDENTIYRYDSVKGVYVILNNILDIKVIQGIIK